jgi:putative membrane protein
MSEKPPNFKLHIILLTSLIVIFIWSYYNRYDSVTWYLEAAPVVIGLAILIFVYSSFRMTNLVYVLIWTHAVILLIGAHYTYARVPLFNWLRDTFELSRNHYDRLGHFFQGFVPAIIAREVLLRKSPLKQGGWLFSIILAFCLAVSALYELFEWTVVVVTGDNAALFLAAQGDMWDTQKDMALCFIGAVVSLLTLSKFHNKSLGKI